MKIGIVGAGWLGKPLAEKLANEGHTVTAFYRTNIPEFAAEVQTIQLSDEQLVEATLKLVDVVVFCFPAPRTPLPELQHQHEWKSHAQVCLDLVKHCKEDCRFVFTSTTGVYPNENKSFDETAILDSSNKHVETENTLQEALGKRLTIVRLAGLVGEGRFPVRMMSKSGKVYNANEYCNLIALEDAVGIIEFTIEKNVQVGVINACAPNHPLKGEYYTDMAVKLGVEPPTFEKGPTGKFIQSDLSILLGYQYKKPDPFDFY